MSGLVDLVHLNNSPGCEGWCNSPVQQQFDKAGLMPLKLETNPIYFFCTQILFQCLAASPSEPRVEQNDWLVGADDKKVPRLIVRCQA